MSDVVRKLEYWVSISDSGSLCADLRAAKAEIERLREALREIAKPRRGHEWRMRIAEEALGDG